MSVIEAAPLATVARRATAERFGHPKGLFYLAFFGNWGTGASFSWRTIGAWGRLLPGAPAFLGFCSGMVDGYKSSLRYIPAQTYALQLSRSFEPTARLIEIAWEA